MLSDPEHVEPDAVRQLDLFEQVRQPLLAADRLSRLRVRRQLRERVDPELHRGLDSDRWFDQGPSSAAGTTAMPSGRR
jgi:hypothetical protein